MNDPLAAADGKIDPRERRFLRRPAADFDVSIGAAGSIIDAMLVKNRL